MLLEIYEIIFVVIFSNWQFNLQLELYIFATGYNLFSFSIRVFFYFLMSHFSPRLHLFDHKFSKIVILCNIITI